MQNYVMPPPGTTVKLIIISADRTDRGLRIMLDHAHDHYGMRRFPYVAHIELPSELSEDDLLGKSVLGTVAHRPRTVPNSDEIVVLDYIWEIDQFSVSLSG